MAKYKVIKVNGKSKDEHRHIMEQHLNKKLNYNETIHHINGNGKDNRIENLEIISRSQHTKNQWKKYRKNNNVHLKCPWCQKDFNLLPSEYKQKSNNKQMFCSRSCSSKYYNNVEKINRKQLSWV